MVSKIQDVYKRQVVAYCIGMAFFTMIMGNAFAAFAMITSAIGVPVSYTHLCTIKKHSSLWLNTIN